MQYKYTGVRAGRTMPITIRHRIRLKCRLERMVVVTALVALSRLAWLNRCRMRPWGPNPQRKLQCMIDSS